MALPKLDLRGIVAAVQSHAGRAARFDRVQGSELIKAPGRGLSLAVWVDELGPARGRSGLAETCVRLALAVRLYSPVEQARPDDTDPELLGAVDALMRAYSGDFTLDGTVAEVDLLGRFGDPLGGRAGYVTLGDKTHRVFTIALPLIIDDLFAQAP